MKIKKSVFEAIRAEVSEKGRHMLEASILVHAANNLVSNLKENNYKSSFCQLKKAVTAGFKSSKDAIIKPQDIK